MKRRYWVRGLLAVPLSLLFFGCASRPEKTGIPAVPFTMHVKTGGEAKALWVATSNFSSGGALDRLDLRDGKLKTAVLATGSDTAIFPDGAEGLFLLTRKSSDSVVVLREPHARVEAQRPLTGGSNPQCALRDSGGRVWVTTLDTNAVEVYDPNLRERLASFDLSALKDEDGYAELGALAKGPRSEILAAAGRLRRGKVWVPEPQSGIAVFDSEALKLLGTSLVEVSNPLAMGILGEKLTLVSSGDLSVTGRSGSRARVARLELREGTPSLLEAESREERILDAQLYGGDQTLTLITWAPERLESCIQAAGRQVHCEKTEEKYGGFVFNKVLRLGQVVFASSLLGQTAELWAIDLENGRIEKTALPMPVVGLSPGP